MHRSMTGDSLFSRRRWLGLWLPALLVVAATLLGGERAAAQEGQTPGFIWGPAAPSELRAPLGDPGVLKALVLAVDADTISGTLLVGPGLLAYVDDASQPVELWQGWSGFVPEKSRILLEDSGVTSVTLTIAGDPDVPVTAQIAEAIAADLRANIGAQVTVVEGDADFVVRQAVLSEAPPPEPTPLPPLPAGRVSFEVTCTPDTFQPDVWVAVECTSRITNNGPEPLSDMTVNVGGTIGVIPNYYWMWYIRDGQYTPIGISDLSFGEAGALQPGQTTASRLVLLLQMSEGTYETTDTVDVGGREGASAPIKFTASSGAEAPPKDLLVTRTLVGEPALEGTPVAAATYETKVTNRGSSAVTALTITDRSDAIPFVGAEPAPSSRNTGVDLAFWNLASFGKDSLAPGESLVLRTTYGPADDSGCSSMSSGVVVEANVGGKAERYGLRPEDAALLGDCGIGEGMPGGRGGPMTGAPATGFGSGGEGPAPPEGDVVWAVALVLASGGLVLVTAARLMRSRSRR